MARKFADDLVIFGGLSVNESGAAVDTRVEGDTDVNLLFIDASTDRVGIGTATPGVKLDVNGDFGCTGVPYTGSAQGATGDSLARRDYVDSGLATKEPLRSVRTVNPSAGVIDINANTDGDTIKSTLTADATLNVPTNGFEDQIIQGVVLASGAQRVLTFHASYGRLTAIAATLTIPSGKVGRYAIRRTDITGSAKWLVESVGVEQ